MLTIIASIALTVVVNQPVALPSPCPVANIITTPIVHVICDLKKNK